MTTYNLSELIYESVTDEYGWGKYGDFKVLIRRKDGYINATKLCKDGGKLLGHWSETQGSKQFVEEFKGSIGIPIDPLEAIVTGPNNTRGTYAHPELIPHIASWVSPKFAVMVSRIVNNYLIKEYKEELYQKDVELGKRKDKIDELLDEVKGLSNSNQLLHQKLDLANENIIEAVRGVNQANNSIRGVHSKLDRTADNSVPPDHLQPKDEETYALYFCERNGTQTTYTQCRARPFHLRRRVAELMAKYPNFREVVNFKPVPNARALASEYERRIQERGAIFNLARQTILLDEETKLNEEEMIALANAVFNERRDPAEEALIENPVVTIDINESGHLTANIQIEEEHEEETREPTHQERFATLFQLRLPELKDIARGFPRSKTFGGWSGKPKTELVNWILSRRGFEVV